MWESSGLDALCIRHALCAYRCYYKYYQMLLTSRDAHRISCQRLIMIHTHRAGYVWRCRGCFSIGRLLAIGDWKVQTNHWGCPQSQTMPKGLRQSIPIEIPRKFCVLTRTHCIIAVRKQAAENASVNTYLHVISVRKLVSRQCELSDGVDYSHDRPLIPSTLRLFHPL
jgi:hypothetical protein